MHKIFIEDIEKETNKTLYYEFDSFMQEFNANIKASLKLESLGEFIIVSGSISSNLKLICDRCLNEFAYILNTEINETYAKDALLNEYSQEVELQKNQFITDLNGEKEIDIYDLLYQSIILALPNKKVCGINCNEGMFVSDENLKLPDSRMEIFKNIKIENNN